MKQKFLERSKKSFLGLILLIAGGIGGEALQDIITQRALNAQAFALLLAALTTISIVVLLLDLIRKADEIYDKIGVDCKYYPIDNERERAKLFKRCEEIISSAQTSIFALNSYAEECPHPDARVEDRRRYFRAFESRARPTNNPRPVNYKRIVQVNQAYLAETGKSIGDLFHETYRDHFEVMLNQRKVCDKQRLDKRVDLDWIPALFPSTFVIVDEKFLLWQLNEIDPDNADKPIKQRLRMRGVIIAKDRDGDFIGEFMKTFERAREHGRRRVSAEDLIPLQAPLKP